ncbi:MAG TPA: hypothetical protein VNA17_06915, partial [Pyrinomonadaceae bacterium]|nr:hypothetical protein [Pyrinomonadaceae bacterium]
EVKGKQRFIETVRGRGYRFIEDVKRVTVDDAVSGLMMPQTVVPSGRKRVQASSRKHGIGNLATVVSLSEWRHEPEPASAMEPEAVVAPAKVKSTASLFRRYRLAAVTIVVCIGLGLGGLYWSNVDTSAVPITSVAVLPFVNFGSDPELEYFSEGLGENLIDRLSELPQLKVIARSSSFKYREEAPDLQDVARKLGVQAIVTGRVMRRGDDLTIRIDLVDAQNDKQLWGEQFNRKAVDILALQSEIARTVSGKLHLKLSGAQESQLARRGTDNPQAYDLLIKGDFFAKKSATRSKALEYYNQAVALDPNYSLAHAKVAQTYHNLAADSVLDPKDVMPMVQAAVRRAIELDENSADAHFMLAELAHSSWDWKTAEYEYSRALELNPNLVRAHRRYSSLLSDVGRHDQAIAEARRVRELDPQQLVSHLAVPTALLFARRFDESIVEVKETLEMGQIYGSYGLLGSAYAGKGMYQEAIAAFKESIRIGGNNSYLKICLGAAYAGAGKRENAQTVLKQLEGSKEYISPGELPILYSALGEYDKAFATLEKAYAARDLQLKHLNAELGFDPLRNDPRFADLVRRVGLPQ